MVDISIEYDKEVYSPGDKVSVRILINVVGSPKKICSIRIALNGRAVVSWYENHDKWVKHYTSEHTYISDLNYLLLNRPDENTIILPVGEHSYDYDFILPDSCDSSYRKGYGKIKYECKVEIVRAFPSRDIKYVKTFNVFRPVDFSEERNLPSPVTQTHENRFLPFEKCSITINGNIPKTCYLPGETINLEASLFNHSPRTISSMEIRLVEATTYIASFTSFYTSEHQRIKRNRLVDLKENLQIETGSDFYKSQDIKIPQFTPVHNNCPYIIVNYYIKILAKTSFGTSASMKIPLVIGSISSTHSNSRTDDIISSIPLISIEECVESNTAHPSLFQSENSIVSSGNGFPSLEGVINESDYSNFTDGCALIDLDSI